MRRSSIVYAAIGTLLIVAAAALSFVLVPMAKKLPSSTNATLHYTGNGTLLNAAAVQSGDLAHVLAKDVPITVERHVYVSKVGGNRAIAHDDQTLHALGQTIPDPHAYAVNRTNLGPATAFGGVAVENTGGVTIALPIGPKAQSGVYKLYDPASQQAAATTYVGKETRGGRSVQYYTSDAVGAVKDPSLLKTLPAVLPKALAVKLLPLLPAATQQKIAAVAAQLPDQIPLTYTVDTKTGVWVDSQLGAPLDTTIHRTVVATVRAGAQTIPLLPVLDLNLAQTKASVDSLASKAKTASLQLSILGIWLPLLLLAIGIALWVIAIVRRHPKAASTGQGPSHVESIPDAAGRRRDSTV